MNMCFIRYMCMAVLPILAGSCIFDDFPDCPASQYVVQISVKDVNYENAKSFPQIEPKDGNMPFYHFVGTIYYVLSDLTTGARIRESAVMAVNGKERTYPIIFNDIPEGEYVLTVWGNVTQEYPAGALHPDNKEHTDVYMASRTLKFDSSYQMTELPLERTKGLLLLFCSTFPTGVTSIKQNVTYLYHSVNEDFHYADSEDVEKHVPFQPLMTTFLAPTSERISGLKLSFYTGDARTEKLFLELPDMEITIKRNEISSVAIDYKETEGVYEIWVFVQEQWTMVHRLDIK